jgi:hypothetical protein
MIDAREPAADGCVDVLLLVVLGLVAGLPALVAAMLPPVSCEAASESSSEQPTKSATSGNRCFIIEASRKGRPTHGRQRQHLPNGGAREFPSRARGKSRSFDPCTGLDATYLQRVRECEPLKLECSG